MKLTSGEWQPQEKTIELIGQVKQILDSYSMALTIRQLYYQLVAKQIILNNLKSYKNLDAMLSKARKNNYLDFNAFTDRIRRPIKDGSWLNLNDFISAVKRSYSKDKWDNQENYVEVWLEKDALAGIFEPITQKYDVNLLVGRGYQSLSSLNDAVRRFPDKDIYILYFGDFDPTGLDIPRSAEENLVECFGISPTFERISLTKEDIDEHKLPPAPAKTTDSRTYAFIKEHGNISVELDALPPDVLEEKIRENIKKYLDLEQFLKDLKVEEREISKLAKLKF